VVSRVSDRALSATKQVVAGKSVDVPRVTSSPAGNFGDSDIILIEVQFGGYAWARMISLRYDDAYQH